jgi:hypothetical protein
VSAVLTASRLRDLEQVERRLARPLTTVRRIAVASLAPFPTPALTRLLARTTARHRPGRILFATPEWQQFPDVPEARLAEIPPGAAGRLRTHGTVWVGDPGLDDRFFDVAFADAGPITVDDLVPLARSRAAVCLVVPLDRAAAETAVGLAEQLTREGRRVVVAFDRTRPGRAAWARSVTPRLLSPAVMLERDAALRQPARPFAARTVVAAAELAGHLLGDPVAEEPR